MFSDRLPANLAANRLFTAAEGLRARGTPIVDLTESNPTRAGLAYGSTLLAPLADPRGLVYEPHPRGLASAREAIAADYERRGFDVRADRLVLTASTSEAYSLLFKLLANPGDDVLVPRPSYPLFEHLTQFDAVTARSYDLEYHGRWQIDLESVERALTARTRAILIVSPNNPTGSFVKQDELQRLAELASPRGMALIADEVFADYVLDADAAGSAARTIERKDLLTFGLGGLSKSVGLPQLKLAWIAVGGPPNQLTAVLDRLELVADTYLSVSTPVQAAAGQLLTSGAEIRAQIRARITANHASLVARAAAVPACSLLHAEGGWSAVLQVPTLESEEDLVLDLLQTGHVLTHPGYFFDFPRGSFLVLSLLPPELAFNAGVDRILRRYDRVERA
jgi:alanine-synthesizing transaminase